ncbi:uncharacterized protein [Ptychodera flava]|uniref:uncharacterized protein n=1 Tax=Ptychodera flava TaxID=63121 RepID=UPI00396A078F
MPQSTVQASAPSNKSKSERGQISNRRLSSRLMSANRNNRIEDKRLTRKIQTLEEDEHRSMVKHFRERSNLMCIMEQLHSDMRATVGDGFFDKTEAENDNSANEKPVTGGNAGPSGRRHSNHTPRDTRSNSTSSDISATDYRLILNRKGIAQKQPNRRRFTDVAMLSDSDDDNRAKRTSPHRRSIDKKRQEIASQRQQLMRQSGCARAKNVVSHCSNSLEHRHAKTILELKNISRDGSAHRRMKEKIAKEFSVRRSPPPSPVSGKRLASPRQAALSGSVFATVTKSKDYVPSTMFAKTALVDRRCTTAPVIAAPRSANSIEITTKGLKSDTPCPPSSAATTEKHPFWHPKQKALSAVLTERYRKRSQHTYNEQLSGRVHGFLSKPLPGHGISTI